MGRYINIGNRKVGIGQPVFIIAEAGVNHNGKLKLAKKMIEIAKSAGADAIKFQTYNTERLVTYRAPKARYQRKSIFGKSQFEMLKKAELSYVEFKELKKYCNRKGIIFLSTPFDFQSAEFLHKLGMPAFKIGSGELTSTPLLLQIGKYRKPIILSTGMSTLREVRQAVQAIYSTDNKKIALLHCTSGYPVRYKDVNLKAMNTLNRKFNLPAGYSDHTCGIEISVAASAMGACIIEKHFTLDKNFPGPDHKSSLEPDGLRQMIRSIRNFERAKGTGIKMPRQSEIEIKKVARKSVVAACDIPEGTRLRFDMLTIKRPGTGIEPALLERLIDRKLKTGIKRDHVLKWENIR